MGATARAIGARLGRGLVVVALAAVVLLVFAALPPHSLSAKLHLLGYAICHQQPARSFYLGGEKLPMCARDTGTYLGAVVTLAVLLAARGRRRNGLPSGPVLIALAGGFAFFAVDGLNSYASALPVVPELYVPSNYLRLLSGMGCGIAIVAIVLPLFNYSVWRDLEDGPILDWRGYLRVLAFSLAAASAVVWGPGWLYYPVALTIMGGVVVVLAMVNGLLAFLIAGQERRAHTWLDTLPVFAAGILMTAAELGALGYSRYLLEHAAPV